MGPEQPDLLGGNRPRQRLGPGGIKVPFNPAVL